MTEELSETENKILNKKKYLQVIFQLFLPKKLSEYIYCEVFSVGKKCSDLGLLWKFKEILNFKCPQTVLWEGDRPQLRGGALRRPYVPPDGPMRGWPLSALRLPPYYFYMFICFIVVHHKSCIGMMKIILHSLTRNNYHKMYPD